MTDPRPLLEGEPSEAERLLLTSSRLDRPPADGRARALAALGLAAGLGTAATSGTAAASPLGVALIAKWFVVGAFSGVVVAASVATAVHYVDVERDRATANANAGAARVSVGAAQRVEPNSVAASAHVVVTEDPPAERAAPAHVAVAEDPPAPAERPVPAPHRAAEPAPASSQGLSAEIAAFDRARQAMARGNASQALTLLDEYDANFRARTFSQEAMVLRVEALHALGRDRDAARLGERLLVSAPTSAHAQRIRSLLASLHVQK